MRLIILSCAAAAALAACGEPSPPASPEPAPAEPAATAPATPDAAPGAAGTAGAQAPAAPANDCGAAERQNWVGRSRAELPSAPPGAVWRIYETGQPVTMDFNPARLNIEINPDSQNVVRVSCG